MQRQAGQRLVARGGGGQQPIQQALDGKQQPRDIGLGMLEVEARNQRLRDPQRLHRRLQDTGGALVQTMRLPAETAADALRRQRQKGAHRPHTELVQTVMERRVDTQPAERRLPHQDPLGSAIPDDRYRAAGRDGPDDGIRAEAREAAGDGRLETGCPQRSLDRACPLAERRMEVRQTRGVQPEHSRLIAARLDAGREPAQLFRNHRH